MSAEWWAGAVRVFLDTNVWLSAAVFPGLCAELLLEIDARGHRILTSALVREEAHAVLRRKFPRHGPALERFDALWACAALVPDVAEPAADADARLVAAAHTAGAEVFITGDPRVLGWDPRGGLRIFSPRQAWEQVILMR
jgi:predicted nucleic acid-binding protein